LKGGSQGNPQSGLAWPDLKWLHYTMEWTTFCLH